MLERSQTLLADLTREKHLGPHRLFEENSQPQCHVIMPGKTILAIGLSINQRKTNVGYVSSVSAEFTARNAIYVCA
jgi:hypothetical protein